MYNTGTPISSKLLRQERWERTAKEAVLIALAGLGAVVMIIGMGLWVIAMSI